MIHFLIKGQRRPANSVYVDHPSAWACPKGWDVAQYTLWVLHQRPLIDALPTLRGKTLVLYKRDDNPVTHAHILEALANLTISLPEPLILKASKRRRR